MCVILFCNLKRLIFFSGGVVDELEYYFDNDRGRVGCRYFFYRFVLFLVKK